MTLEDEIGQEIYVAGESVPSGIYKHLDSPHILELDGEDTLPGRLDGRATYYVRLRHTWRAPNLRFADVAALDGGQQGSMRLFADSLHLSKLGLTCKTRYNT